MSSTPMIFSERELLASLIDSEQDELLALDTGQNALPLDTGQEANTGDDALSLSQLVIRKHEIHRRDEVADGESELVTSTLKYFHINVELIDLEGAPVLQADGGRVHAALVYEDGDVVEEVSASLEPPLLGGDAQLEGGCATFRLRITVLSSLCAGRKFRLHIALESRPDVYVISQAVKTITKLRRGSRATGASAAKESVTKTATDVASKAEACGLRAASPQSPVSTNASTSVKRALSASAPPAPGAKGAKEVAPRDEVAVEKTKPATTSAVAGLRSLSSLWDEVRSNSQTLLKLQEQQRELFAELRRLSGRGDQGVSHMAAAAAAGSTAICT